MQWNMYRPFMRAPLQLLEDEELGVPIDQTARITQLPNWVLDGIFDELDVLDRCSLALTGKFLLLYAQKNEHLDYIIQQPPKVEDLQHFFERQLGRGWIPRDLRYCSDCGRFVSTNPLHWRHVSEKYTREHSGRISHLWRGRREDGWLRYWIERWCEQGEEEGDFSALALRKEDTTRVLCPRCAIQNPDCNMWRRRRVDLQNLQLAVDHRVMPQPVFHFPPMMTGDPQSYHQAISWPTSSVTISLGPPSIPMHSDDYSFGHFPPTPSPTALY